MPSIIETLTLENQTLVTITENDSTQHALSRMIEHDFSQLPVIDEAQKCNEQSENLPLRELLFIYSAVLSC